MLCPRCNSENDAGEKFCRHCGAPMADRDLFLSEKEKKKLEKEKQKKEKKVNLKKIKISNFKLKTKKNEEHSSEDESKPKRTYSVNEETYHRNYTKMIISLSKSVFMLLVIIVMIYFVSGFILVSYFKNASNYSVSGNKIPTANYVLGDRKLNKVKFSFEGGSLKTKYIFENVDSPRKDVVSYVTYLIEKSNFRILGDYNTTVAEGSVKLGANSVNVPDDMVVVEIQWTKKTITIITSHSKSTIKTVNE